MHMNQGHRRSGSSSCRTTADYLARTIIANSDLPGSYNKLMESSAAVHMSEVTVHTRAITVSSVRIVIESVSLEHHHSCTLCAWVTVPEVQVHMSLVPDGVWWGHVFIHNPASGTLVSLNHTRIVRRFRGDLCGLYIFSARH